MSVSPLRVVKALPKRSGGRVRYSVAWKGEDLPCAVRFGSAANAQAWLERWDGLLNVVAGLRDPVFRAGTKLRHVTDGDTAGLIDVEGVKAGSYWTSNPSLADYYSSTICDDGKEPAVFEISLADMDVATLAPDLPGVDEPITTVLGFDEKTVRLRYSVAAGVADGWIASLAALSSLRCTAALPASMVLRLGHPPSAAP